MNATIAIEIKQAGPAQMPGLARIIAMLFAMAPTEKSEDTNLRLSEDIADIRNSLDGDGEAFRRIVERHQQHVAVIMWRFSRDPHHHKELVQDVFIETYTSLANYRPVAPFSHWLARIATRVGYKFWRRQMKERKTPTLPIEDWDGLENVPVNEINPEYAAELLYKLLAQLPPRDRLVLTLRYVDGHSIAKTAELAGWTKMMVKVQALRARAKLRKLFEETEKPQ